MSFEECTSSWVRSMMRVRGYVISVDRYAIRSYRGIWGQVQPGMVGRGEAVIVSGSWVER
jgi:hypothetical protein